MSSRAVGGSSSSGRFRTILSFILSIVFAFVTSGVWAADWTDKDDPTVTYTALKSINGGGSGATAGGYIITDITPAGTEIVKFKVKTPGDVSANGCVYCARSFTYKSKKWSVAATQFAGFRLATKFRIDRMGTQTSLADVTCAPTTEYSVSADYSTGDVTVNNVGQSQNLGTKSYTPDGKLAIFASYSNIAAPASPTASSSWGNYLPDDLYYLQLWNADGETLKHDFRPARRDSDDVIGLYDTVVQKFWPATSGSFTGVELSSVTTATWTGVANNGDFSDSGNWTCYDGDGNAVADVIPESTTDITLGADVPDAGWANFDAAYAGTINLNGHRLVICGGSDLKFTVTDSSSGASGELRFTIPENETFEKTAALRISGNLSLVKDGPGTFLWSHAAESALSAAIPVLVTNGVFKIGATTGNLFGAGGTVAVKAPGQFDINTAQKYGPVRARTFYIEGDGPDGSGAIVNSAANTQWGYQLNKIVLTGDATIGGRGFIDIRESGNGIDCGEYKLTVKNTGRLCVEAGTHLNSATDIVVNGGNLLVCNSCVLGAERIVLENGGTFLNYMDSGTKAYTVPFVVRAGSETSITNTITTSKNDFSMNKPITVESGATLSLTTGGPWYAGFTNKTDATIVVSGGEVCLTTDSILKNDGVLDHIGGNLYVGHRDDDTGVCTVENNGLIRSAGGEFVFKPQSSMIGSGTLELAGGSPQVLGDLSGFTGTVVVSNGVAITFAGINCGGTVEVYEGTTLALDGATQSSFGALTLAAGSTLDIATPAPDVAAFAATTLNLPAEGAVVTLTSGGGAFVEGIYAICKMSGVTTADGEKFAPSTGELEPSWSVDGDTLILTVGAIDGNTWTGGANDGNLSNPANWYGGAVPTSGTATINTSGELTVGALFNPDVIVFPETCGAVTIKGENTIAELAAVTNLSSSICTFEVPVEFADKIDVYQTAYYYINQSGDSVLRDGGHVRFVGGVTGTGFAEGTTRRLDGAYTIPATAGWVANTTDNVWTLPGATEAGGSSLTITGSSHEMPGTTDTSMLLLGSGSAFTTGVVRTSNRLSYRIFGEYVVTNMLEVALTQDTYIAQRYDGTYKFEELTLSDNGTGWNFYVANSTRDDGTKHLYIGAGGINVNGTASTSTALVCGYDNKNSHDVTHLHPWHGDYAINGKGGSTRDILVYRTTHLYTDDENGVARKVTLNGIADVRAALTINGSGRFQVNSDGMNGEANRIGGITVTDSATLSYAPGADLGAGAVTVGANATMELASGAHTFEGGLTLNDGATLAFNFTQRAVTPQIAIADGKALTVNGEVKVKIPADSKWPTAGEKILTTCGGFDAEGVTVSLAEDAPKWVRGLSVVDGNIVLDVKPMGTKVIVR